MRMNSLRGGVSLLAMILRNAEGGSGAAGGEGGEGGTKPAETVLFPNEGGEGGDKTPADGSAGDPPKDDASAAGGDWKEYTPDPAKSDEENAAAKVEHDKTKPAGKDDKDKKDDPADKVPEDGKYALTMPEGVEVDQELLDAVSPEFKSLGLTTKQAQALTDKFIATQQARAEKQAEGWSNTLQKWVDDAKADKDIGGTKWDATVKDSRRAVDRLGTPELREYLNASGGGNHPELIRFMAKVGSMIKEDNPAAGGAEGAGKPVEAAHRLFPNDAPKGK
jgi:hypothetical protein